MWWQGGDGIVRKGRLAAALAGFILLSLSVAVWSQPAGAHALLAESKPADGATVDLLNDGAPLNRRELPEVELKQTVPVELTTPPDLTRRSG